MMKGFWIFTVLVICKAWSINSEVHSSYNPGSNVNLTCGVSKKLFHVIWNIELKNKKCTVTFKEETQNFCRAGLFITKQANNLTTLHIPNFSESDVGYYTGSAVYVGHEKTCNFTLSTITHPRLSSRLEKKYGKLVAVCKAEGANPAANITWKQAGNSSVEEKRSLSDQLYTTESRLTLPEHYNYNSSSIPVCSVRHPAWEEEQLLSPQLPGLPLYQVCIISVFIAFFILAGTFLSLYKHRKFLLSRCRGHVDPSITESQEKEDVEEVEPYASYVQRVNSIYNS